MARFDKSSTKRPKPNAAVAPSPAKRRQTAPSIEDTMFFPRLRRHAKWMFVFLAVALGGGFVVFGVGAGGTGIGDLFRNQGGGTGSPSISKARGETEKNPKDAQAWRDLSTALQTDGKTDDAIGALTQYTVLKPKDADGLRELAGLYLSQSSEKQQNAQILQLQASYSGAAGAFPGVLTVNGKSVLDDQISQALIERSSIEVNDAVTAAQNASSQAVATYQRIAALQPEDPNVQLELAQTAQQVGSSDVAIAAYTKFLKLAPDDSNAPIVKQQLKALQKAAASSGSSG
jgi:tetratricopeptide (TPR) repeat protein